MEIRPTLTDELPILAEFLTSQGMNRSAEELHWKFLQSPGVPNGSSTSFVAELDGEIVGHIGIVPTKILLDQSSAGKLQGGWFVDWLVREDLRSRAIGILLLREAAKHYPALMTIQGSADTQAALPQLQWSANRNLAVYKLNVRSGAIDHKAGLAHKIMGSMARVLYYHPVTHHPPAGWHLHERPDSPWDLLDAVLQRQGPNLKFCLCERSGTFLRWSFKNHPTHRYNLLVASDMQGPVGYVIWRIATRPDGQLEGRIVDIAAPWDGIEGCSWLISTATKKLADLGVVQILCLAGCGSPLSKAMKQNRYVPRQKLPIWASPQATGLTDQTGWHATFADSDIDTTAEA